MAVAVCGRDCLCYSRPGSREQDRKQEPGVTFQSLLPANYCHRLGPMSEVSRTVQNNTTSWGPSIQNLSLQETLHIKIPTALLSLKFSGMLDVQSIFLTTLFSLFVWSPIPGLDLDNTLSKKRSNEQHWSFPPLPKRQTQSLSSSFWRAAYYKIAGPRRPFSCSHFLSHCRSAGITAILHHIQLWVQVLGAHSKHSHLLSHVSDLIFSFKELIWDLSSKCESVLQYFSYTFFTPSLCWWQTWFKPRLGSRRNSES